MPRTSRITYQSTVIDPMTAPLHKGPGRLSRESEDVPYESLSTRGHVERDGARKMQVLRQQDDADFGRDVVSIANGASHTEHLRQHLADRADSNNVLPPERRPAKTPEGSRGSVKQAFRRLAEGAIRQAHFTSIKTARERLQNSKTRHSSRIIKKTKIITNNISHTTPVKSPIF